MGDIIPKNILILKYRAMGDSIIGLSAVKYLKELYPEAKIVYGMPNWIAPLYNGARTSADEIFGFNLNGLSDWWSLYKKLKEMEIDTVVEMFQSGRTSKFFKAWSLMTGGKYYAHNHHLKEGTTIQDQGMIKPVIQRDLDGIWSHFARSKGLEIPKYTQYEPTMLVDSVYEKNQIIFGVVATRQTKMWNLSNYVELAKLLKESDPTLKIIIPLSSSEADEAIKKQLLKQGIEGEIIQGPLSNLPALFAGSRAYIGNDTGIKHLAIAVGVKSYTLFGPEPPLEWHPYDPEKHPYFYLEGLECRTRESHYCGLSSCESMACLKEFTPKHVNDSVRV